MKPCPNNVPCPMDGFQTYCEHLWTEKCPYWEPEKKEKKVLKYLPFEYVNLSVGLMAIGYPSDEQRNELIKNGFTFIKREVTKNNERYEIWLK